MRAQRIIGLVVLLWIFGWPAVARAQAVTATLSIPAGVSFAVPNVTQSVSGSPEPFRVVFSTTGMKGSQDLYVSVKADSASFAGPGATHIPASKVSWTSTPVGRGAGSAGTLSSAAYAAVYQTNNNKSGAFDMTWTLASIAAAGLRAGTHTITVRWRVEAF
jgi:hypothetical protein